MISAMSDAAANSPPSDLSPAARDRDMAVIEWPRPTWLGPLVWFAVMLLIAGMMLASIDAASMSGLTWRLMAAVGLVAFAVILIAVEFSAHASQQRELQAVFDEATLAVARAGAEGAFDWEQVPGAPGREQMIAAILRTRSIDTRPAGRMTQPIRMLLDDLQALRINRPDVIVDHRIADRLREIPVRREMLEPEPVTSRWELSTWVVDLAMLLAAAIWVWRVKDMPLRFLMPVSCLSPLIVRRFGAARLFFKHGVRPGDSGLVAGVGYLERADGSRISSTQAITVVYKHWSRPLCVRLGTRERCEDVYFTSTRDPGFIAFWQRWNHPHPRPELLGDKPTIRSQD